MSDAQVPLPLHDEIATCLQQADSLAACRGLVATYQRWAPRFSEPTSHDAHWTQLLWHQLTTSALAYCLAAERGLEPGILAEMRLGALTHHLPEDLAPHGAADTSRGLLATAHATAIPGPIDDTLLKENLDMVGVVFGGATRIKRYVFEGSNLTELRGASMLLDHLNRSLVPALFGAADGTQVEPFVQAPECVVYANGGEVLALVPANAGDALCSAIERLYHQHTLTAQAVLAWRRCRLLELRQGPGAGEELPSELGTAPMAVSRLLHASYGHGDADRLQERIMRSQGFGEVVKSIAVQRLSRRDANAPAGLPPRHPAHFEALPFAEVCQGCGARMAVAAARLGDHKRLLCEPCGRKRLVGQAAGKGPPEAGWWQAEGMRWEPPGAVRSWFAEFAGWLSEQPQGLQSRWQRDGQERQAPRDLDDVGQASEPRGYIGLVYADLNGMGSLLRHSTSPDRYRQLSLRTHAVLREMVFQGLAGLPPAMTSDGTPRYPFEIVAIGGDDVLLIVPGNAALDLALGIGEQLDRTFAIGEEEDRGSRLYGQGGRRLRPRPEPSVSLAVTIAPMATSITILEGLAGEQLRIVKNRWKTLRARTALQYHGSIIDFQVLRSISAIVAGLDGWRDKNLRRGNLRMTFRPYTLPEMAELLATVRGLKRGGAQPSQLHALRDSLEQGQLASTLYYQYVSRGRNGQPLRDQLERRWFAPGTELWRRRLVDEDPAPTSYETMVADLLEVYDFVPEERRAARRRR